MANPGTPSVRGQTAAPAPVAQSEASKVAAENTARQADGVKTPREIATMAGAPAVDAVVGVHPPMAHLVNKDEPMVKMVVPKSFVLTGDDGKSYPFTQGVMNVPERLAGHWYLKAHGVLPFDQIGASHKVIRDAEDAELASRRAVEDAEIANRRAEEDRADMAQIAAERQGNVAALDALNAGVDPAIATKRAEDDRALADLRAEEDHQGAPDAKTVAARRKEDSDLVAKRTEEDRRAREANIVSAPASLSAKRASEDQALRDKRAAEDRKEAPDEETLEARKRADADLAARRSKEDAAARKTG